MFSYGGPINQIIQGWGHQAIGFLDVDAIVVARVIGLLVNAWIGVPSIMLLATGLLSNRDESLYENLQRLTGRISGRNSQKYVAIHHHSNHSCSYWSICREFQ